MSRMVGVDGTGMMELKRVNRCIHDYCWFTRERVLNLCSMLYFVEVTVTRMHPFGFDRSVALPGCGTTLIACRKAVYLRNHRVKKIHEM